MERPPPVLWTKEDWARALAARPDLMDRLRAGDPDVFAEMCELVPGVKVGIITKRRRAR